MSKRILVSFGRSDPLHLTEATHELLGDGTEYPFITYLWGEKFNRPMPKDWTWVFPADTGRYDICSIANQMYSYDVVYCGHGATLLEATAAGCEVMVLTSLNPIGFHPAWLIPNQLDHSGKEVWWQYPGVMAAMAAEIRERRK